MMDTSTSNALQRVEENMKKKTNFNLENVIIGFASRLHFYSVEIWRVSRRTIAIYKIKSVTRQNVCHREAPPSPPPLAKNKNV